MNKDLDNDSVCENVWRKRLLWLTAGIVTGALSFVVYRALSAKNPNVHYHANFALYINGKQDIFNGPGYYEEVTACMNNNHTDVRSRAHMHNNANHAIHIHASPVTWGDFFANIGYVLGDNLISDGQASYVDGQEEKHLKFILNGHKVSAIANQVIKSEDVLLIDYGTDDDQTQMQHFDAVPKDAHKLNIGKDPSTCSGGHDYGFTARLKDVIGIN